MFEYCIKYCLEIPLLLYRLDACHGMANRISMTSTGRGPEKSKNMTCIDRFNALELLLEDKTPSAMLCDLQS